MALSGPGPRILRKGGGFEICWTGEADEGHGDRPFLFLFPKALVLLTLLAWFWAFPILTVLIRLYEAMVLSSLYPTLLNFCSDEVFFVFDSL